MLFLSVKLFIHWQLSKMQHMWCGTLEHVTVLTLVQAVVSIPAFRHTVTTTYCTQTPTGEERGGQIKKKEKRIMFSLLLSGEMINMNVLQQFL